MTASQKVILQCCTSSFVIAAYQQVLFIPQDSCALHNELFTLPSEFLLFTGPSKLDVLLRSLCDYGSSPKFTSFLLL